MKFRSIFFILLLCGLYANAQIPSEKKVRFGLKAGINASLFTKTVAPLGSSGRNDLQSFRRYLRPSGYGGLTADVNVFDRFTLGAELLFNSRGMAYRERNDYVVLVDDDGNEEQAYNYFNYNIDYLEFPITLAYNFSKGPENALFYGYAGLAPGLAVNYITKLSYEDATTGSGRRANDEKSTLKHVNHFNNSMIAGVRIGDNNARRVSLYADLRFSYTLISVFNRRTDEKGNNLDTRMLTSSLGAGIRF